VLVPSPWDLLRKAVPLPDITIPQGRMRDLPGRGATYVTDVPGPEGAPTIVLLHSFACTGMLTWFPSIAALSEHFRVVVLDQRWHGRGIAAGDFSLQRCADDVAALVRTLDLGEVIVAGYSMGSVVAQRVWRQHPEVVSGLVLCATSDSFANTTSERTFHFGMRASMVLLRGLSRSRVATAAGSAAASVLDVDDSDIHVWAMREFRSVSPWSMGPTIAAIGQHRSTPWLASIDVPTAVVVPTKDRVIDPERQRRVAQLIPTSTLHEVEGGHASCVLQADAFVPVFVEACLETSRRTGKAA
jgi:3-oxoadipate enol-lactonase